MPADLQSSYFTVKKQPWYENKIKTWLLYQLWNWKNEFVYFMILFKNKV